MSREEQQIIVRETADRYHKYKWSAYAFCVDFALFVLCPRLREMLKPYLASKFGQYKDGEYLDVRMPDVTQVARVIEKADASWDIWRKYTGGMWAKECAQFVRRCGEGAFLVLVLMAIARYMYQGKKKDRKGKVWVPFCPEIPG